MTQGRPIRALPALSSPVSLESHNDGAEAYREARERERDVILPDGTTHAGRTSRSAYGQTKL